MAVVNNQYAGQDSLLRSLDASRLVEAQVIITLIQQQVDAYRQLDPEELMPSVADTITRVCDAISAGHGPQPEEIHEAESIRQRVRQNIPAEEVLRAYRLMLRTIRDWVVDTAHEQCIDPKVITQLLRVLWEVNDAASTQFGALHLEMVKERALQDERESAETLHGILEGLYDSRRLRFVALSHGLVVDQSYLPVRGQAYAQADTSALQHTLARTGTAAGRPSFLGISHGYVIGLVAALPDTEGIRAAVGVGPPRPLSAVPASFLLATRAQDAAMQFDLTGVFTVEDLGVRAAIATDQELGEVLAHRFLDPLYAAGDFGTILKETVTEFLSHRLRINDTAEGMYIHPNTLRHRIQRFEELTGADLSNYRTTVDVWWALQFEQHGH